MEDVTADFIAYLKKFDEDMLPGIQSRPELAPLRRIQVIAVKVMFLGMHDKLVMPKGNAAAVVRVMLAKLTNEAWAFIGAHHFGTSVGGWHHVRAILELHASACYVFAEPKLTDRRAAQFTEWPKARRYQQYQKLLQQLKDSTDPKKANDKKLVRIDQATFDRKTKRLTYRNAHQASQEQADRWKDLFHTRTDKWHEGTITDLLEAADAFESKGLKEPSSRLSGWYDIACQATHVSPHGYGLQGGDLNMLGGSEATTTSCMIAMAGAMIHFLRAMDPVCCGGPTFASSIQGDYEWFVEMTKEQATKRAPPGFTL